jgi:ribosomal protein S18 acetylase RimI-like enzyme
LTSLIRAAIPADAGRLAALIRAAYRGTISRNGWTSEADLVGGDRIDVERVLSIIDGPKSMMLVVEQGDDLIACCQLEDRGNNQGYFGTFAVSPYAQGGGLGRRLVTEAQRQAVLRYGSSVLEMTVLAQQENLIAWYERLGFRRTGETRPFPADPIYARPLQEGLYFAVLAKRLPEPPLPGP